MGYIPQGLAKLRPGFSVEPGGVREHSGDTVFKRRPTLSAPGNRPIGTRPCPPEATGFRP